LDRFKAKYYLGGKMVLKRWMYRGGHPNRLAKILKCEMKERDLEYEYFAWCKSEKFNRVLPLVMAAQHGM